MSYAMSENGDIFVDEYDAAEEKFQSLPELHRELFVAGRAPNASTDRVIRYLCALEDNPDTQSDVHYADIAPRRSKWKRLLNGSHVTQPFTFHGRTYAWRSEGTQHDSLVWAEPSDEDPKPTLVRTNSLRAESPIKPRAVRPPPIAVDRPPPVFVVRPPTPRPRCNMTIPLLLMNAMPGYLAAAQMCSFCSCAVALHPVGHTGAQQGGEQEDQ